MYTRNLNSVRYRNLLLRPNGTLDHGNGQIRPVYKIDADLAKQYTNLILLTSNNLGYSYNLTATLAKDFGHGLDASIAYTFGDSKAGNDGTSSQAASNWGYNYSNDINGEELSFSNFDMRHRIIGQLNYRV